MPSAHTAQQKSSINDFVSFTAADKNTAVRLLKNHGWNTQEAVEAYFATSSQNQSPAAKQNLNNLFDKYRDQPNEMPDKIGVEGMMSYLEALGISIEDVGMLIVSEIVQSPDMGEIERKGFVQGWGDNDTLDKQKNLISQRRGNLQTPSYRDIYKRIYKHAFSLGRAPGQKGVSLETALAQWAVLFSAPALEWKTAKTPWLEYWSEFLQAKWKKDVNKDMWDQTLVFAEETLQDESLGFWNENSAWPSVIDEFVEWVREKRGDAAGDDDDVMDED